MENNEIIKEVLTELLQKTIEKKIHWNIINPTAYRWIKRDDASKITTTTTLQKQSSKIGSVVFATFSITIQDSTGAQPIQINSSNDKSINEILKSIFNEAQKESARAESEKQAETIRNLLKGL